MKNFAVLFIVIVLVSCNGSKKKDEPGKGKDTAVTKTVTGTNDTEQFMETLRKLAPLSEDQLKGLIPGTVFGAAAGDINVTSSMGAGLASAEYVVSDTSKVTLNIYDCAGDGGAGVYNMQFANMLDVNIDNEDDYTKTIRIGNAKGYEQCQKRSNDCSITWFSGGRYLVSLESENIGGDELIREAKKINIK